VRGVRDRRRTKNRPLNAFVENGVLTIEIGVDTLAFACLHTYEGEQQRHESYAITDNAGFATDVARELLDEAEDGASMLTDLLDKAMERAIENGAEHYEPLEPESDK
jgi:hypothetical protein